MKYIYLYIFLFFQFAIGQQDFSNQWEDMYSYNNVKDFTIVGEELYALSNNAMFVYNINTNDTQKFSSVSGLSGTTTSSIYFDEVFESIIIGYEDGLIEIISNNKVIPVTGIKDNLILVNKIVNGFYRNQEDIFVFGDFGILELDIEKAEFGNSYKLSNTGDFNSVNKIIIADNSLYAATNNGLYSVDLSLNPTDFNNWEEISSGVITDMITLDNKIFYATGANVYEKNNPSTSVFTVSKNIYNLSTDSSTGDIVVTTSDIIEFFETSSFVKTDEVDLSLATDYNFTTTKAIVSNNELYVNTTQYGVLKTSLTDKTNYIELHPDGPSSNDIFSITVSNDQKWVTYGGHDLSYNGLNKYRGVDYFVNEKWHYLTNEQIGRKKDYLKVMIDPFDSSKVLIASLRDGVTELNNFSFVKRWEKENTNNILPGHPTSLEAFEANLITDKNNIVWVANSRANENYYFSSYNGEKEGAERWESKIDFSSVIGSKFIRGFNKMFVDQNNNVYAASARSGLFVFNANDVTDESSRNVAILDDLPNHGALPSSYIFSVVADENNRVWIGTGLGLVVFDDYENLFENTKRAAKTLIIEENGEARELLADAQVNDIIIDLAGNKWFATQGAGVVQTSSDGQTTYNIFNTSNSPLPDNTILDLELDESTGKVYMVTDKGTLAYDSKNEPFGESITSVIAYPNPAVRNRAGHENVTIVAKDGLGIPEGTNVKIMDMSGKLVYETNVSSSNGAIGGKVVWDKKNLRGNSVVSGVYIVLLSSADGSENTTTKIAIVN